MNGERTQHPYRFICGRTFEPREDFHKLYFKGKLILPPVPIAGVSSTALRLRVVMRRAADVEDALEAICYDDIITTEEVPTFDRCARLIKELEAACIGVTLMQEIGQNKKPREQGTTCCGTYHSGRKPK